jgi:UDP-2,4-diacetamido-2,4,6-trideoxy-beta-L-altropyranose hydrolase
LIANKSIIIRTDGNHDIGLGHVYRMRALAMALADRGWAVIFCTLKDTSGETLLRESGLPVVFTPSEKAAYLPQDLIDKNPDVVLLDILDTDPELLAALRKSCGAKLVSFDDTRAGLALADGVINAIVFHYGRYRPEDAKATLYQGPDYMVLQPSILEQAATRRVFPETVETVFLAFGGTDTHDVSARALEALEGVSTPLSLRINLGPGARLSEPLQKAIERSSHIVTLLENSPSLAKEFQSCDLVLCGGGNMLYELAAMGVPSSAIATEPHEVANIAFWENAGTTLGLGWEKELSLEEMGPRLESLIFDAEKRRKLSINGPKAVDGRGLSRCLDIVEDLVS